MNERSPPSATKISPIPHNNTRVSDSLDMVHGFDAFLATLSTGDKTPLRYVFFSYQYADTHPPSPSSPQKSLLTNIAAITVWHPHSAIVLQYPLSLSLDFLPSLITSP